MFAHGSLQVEPDRPQGRDAQTTHERDEVYLVARGTATFVTDGARRPAPGRRSFRPGDPQAAERSRYAAADLLIGGSAELTPAAGDLTFRS